MSQNTTKEKKKRLSLVPDLQSLFRAHSDDILLSWLVQTVQNASYKENTLSAANLEET